MRLLHTLLILTMLAPMPSIAKHLPDDAEPGTSVNDIALPLTKNTAAELARVETGGRVLSVQEELYYDHNVYRVKVLHVDGKVKTYRIDRDTGQRM
ncbi:PepSY domain-containing protein [Methylophaga sp. OBS3]|uniref:PepSY domain-containing protein n=1 Tax=Methylophaga sp. OBS3 TaxID=2991934 RepID=UPI002258853D|nr:hypothetical protein [Methylophaga sp. OBS3]